MKKSDCTEYVRKWLSALCDDIGSRPVGSHNNALAQKYIFDQFKKWGFSVKTQPFDCFNWEKGKANLTLHNYKIPTVISPYSLPVSFSGEFVFLETIEQLQNQVLKDRVAVLGGELTKEALMPKNFKFWNPEDHQRIIKLLEEKSPKAIVTLSFSNDDPIPVIEDGDFNIPSVTIAGKYAETLKSVHPKSLKLCFDAVRIPSKGANVIARINEDAPEKMVICAHLDTKADTPGALDNATGIATMLLTAKSLDRQKLDRCVEFVAFNGEDYYSAPGQVAYLEKYSEQFNRISLAINCDGVGYKIGKTGISPIACPKHIENSVAQHAENYKNLDLSPPWYQGDHMLFVGADVPALAITSQNIFGILDSVIHSEKDTVELVDLQQIIDTSAFITEIVTAL